MTGTQDAWLELFVVSGLGIAMFIIGILIRVFAQKKNKSCTEKTTGKVVKYRFPGEGRMYPVLEFFVNGKCYRAKKRFTGIKTFSATVPMKGDAWEDEKGWLHVKTGPIINVRKMAESLWPIGSEMNVYYNPKNPKKNYVDRPTDDKLTFILFVIFGLVLTVCGVLMFFLMLHDM
ncbi:DUF3592 domain-containing protein [[Clostridium] cellulosi]